MKNILASLFGSKAKAYTTEQKPKAEPKPKHEASMNFDLEHVLPFLTGLDEQFKFGLDVARLSELAASVKVGNQRSLLTDINLPGKPGKMEFSVFMDDIDAPDVYLFFETSALARDVGDFMTVWAEARGM